ncbi:hypothetical protein [Nocardioides taihuensis]|uniref:Uncharacterized protein n=1 Tax=Nocardioides taihuensis TaxID=1835606 RepID=A0ABW0BEC2_9ACTN
MTETEAVEVARWLAVAAGHDLARYAEPEARLEGDEWFVLFRGVSGAPGDHFAIALHHDTHASRVVEGR